MKKLSFTIALLLLSLCVFAQQKKKYFTDEYGNEMHFDIGNPKTRNSIVMQVDAGTKKVLPFKLYGSEMVRYGNLVYLEGATTIGLESIIHKDSLNGYRYNIIENDHIFLVKDAIPKKVKHVWPKNSDFPNCLTIDLGKFNIANRKIEVQLRRPSEKHGYLNQAVIYNKPLQPAKILYHKMYAQLEGNDRLVGKPFKDGDTVMVDSRTKKLAITMKSTDINFIYDVLIRSNDNKLLYVSTSQFKLDGKNKATTDIEKKCFDKPGNYTVSITPRVGTMFSADIWKDTKNSVSFKFTVVTKEEKTFILKDLLNFGLIIGAVFGVTFVGALNYIKRKNIKKLKVEQQQKEISKMQLNNIRSQLNPHFMFNALAGIQNLMNKDKVDEANRYLNKFARLTRNVLDQKELTSLAEEKELLTDYLQMEQLRFGFTYEINITPDLDISNIEIPAMLLQPFLENAVKHGIAEKESEGKIEVDFSQLNQDLILTIKDNGRGFDVAKSYEGLGLQLSKSRIDLLNTIYQETPVTLELESDLNGTVITLTLTQWL